MAFMTADGLVQCNERHDLRCADRWLYWSMCFLLSSTPSTRRRKFSAYKYFLKDGINSSTKLISNWRRAQRMRLQKVAKLGFATYLQRSHALFLKVPLASCLVAWVLVNLCISAANSDASGTVNYLHFQCIFEFLAMKKGRRTWLDMNLREH